MNFKRLKFNWKKDNKSQSLVELTLVLGILLLLLAGMVEFGNLLNLYINLVDGAREGARFGSNDDPFYVDPDTGPHKQFFFKQIYQIVEGDKIKDPNAKGAINPIVLDPTHDDILVTFFSVTTHAPNPPTLLRFEASPFSKYGNITESAFDDNDIKGKINPDTPNMGFVLVEIFYNYHQILKFIDLSNDPTNPYTIAVHTYSIMPLSAAEPTPTP
jgi:hypothetical protein